VKADPAAIKLFYKQATALFITGILMAAAGCVHIPKDPEKPLTYSSEPAEHGILAEVSRGVLTGQATGISAFMLIPENLAALKWRLALIDTAQQTIDLQVFIWTNDESGRLVLNRIIAAAQRGVRVRLLVDDMPKEMSDQGTALLSRMPNIQVRRFNPGRLRRGLIGRMLQMSTQFQTLNRRMHNKQMIVDGCWGIIGSRNIGNPYFGLNTLYNNRDLDLLMTGPIIHDLADDFDEYWNAPTAYPGEAMYRAHTAEQEEKIWNRFDTMLFKDRELLKKTAVPLEMKDWTGDLTDLTNTMVYGVAQSLQDTPEVTGDRGIRLVEQLMEVTPEAPEMSCIITPYLIPSKKQIVTIENAVRQGRHIQFLVPSMASNNHTMVHSHYKKYRKRLLQAGAELYEFRGNPSAKMRAISDTAPIRSKFISLHAKGFLLDDEWVLLGSLNIDPRSIHINTEHMIIIESPDLARQMHEDFTWMIDPANAWKVSLNEAGQLRWNSDAKELKKQPARSIGQRISDFFYRLLPIESQL
jgi:putative cardiolipin synthase